LISLCRGEPIGIWNVAAHGDIVEDKVKVEVTTIPNVQREFNHIIHVEK
jgi:hypothetical protein